MCGLPASTCARVASFLMNTPFVDSNNAHKMIWNALLATFLVVVIFICTLPIFFFRSDVGHIYRRNIPKNSVSGEARTFLRRALKSQTNGSSVSYEEGLRAWGSSMEYYYNTEKKSQRLDQKVVDYLKTIDEDDAHEPETLDPRRSDDYERSQDDFMREIYGSFLTTDLLFDNVDDYRDDDANEDGFVESTSMHGLIDAYEEGSSAPVISIAPLHVVEPKDQSLCGFLMISAVALVLGANRAIGLYVDRCCCGSGIDELVVSIESPSLDIRASELLVTLLAREV